LRTYIQRYPNGEFATIARALIEHYEQQAKAALAAKDEEVRRQEEEKAEVKRLEEQRRERESALAEECLRAERAKNAAEVKMVEELERAEHAKRAVELKKALEEARLAKEAAKVAEEHRLAVAKAAQEATKAAEDAIATKQQEVGKSNETKVAALPKIEKQAEPIRLGYYGSWDGNCASRPLPKISILSVPKNGRIEFRTELHPVKRIHFGTSKCLGTNQKQRSIYYVSSGSPAASERVSFSVNFGSGNTLRVDCVVHPLTQSRECKSC
jgi:hypothetical protein